jgi:hypothetical protein
MYAKDQKGWEHYFLKYNIQVANGKLYFAEGLEIML